jgi:hypothetical protein
MWFCQLLDWLRAGAVTLFWSKRMQQHSARGVRLFAEVSSSSRSCCLSVRKLLLADTGATISTASNLETLLH